MSTGEVTRVAGALIRLVAPDHEGAEHLRWFFGGGEADGEPPGPWGGAHVELRCEITDASGVRPTEPPSSVNGPVSRWDIGDATVLHHVAGRSAHVTARRITLEPARGGVPAWLTCRQLLAEAASCWWSRRSDLVLHAALLGRDGRGVLVVGPTGAGKSTTVLAALHAGLDVHADDLVVVTGRDHVAHGIPKRPMVERSYGAQLGLPMHSLPGDRRSRVALDTSVLTAGPVHLVGIVVADHAEHVAELTDLPHHETLAALVASSFEAAHGRVATVLPTVAHLAGLPAHRLAHDASSEHRLARAGRLLGELLGRDDQ